MNNIKIKKMSLFDLEQIKDILETDFDDFWNYNILKTDFESPNTIYLVAKQDETILGFAGVLIIDTNSPADITNIVTKKTYRNQGIGTLLLQDLIDLCVQNNLSEIMLEVSSLNTVAINLYKKIGFECISTRKNYYAYNHSDALIMSKKLRKD